MNADLEADMINDPTFIALVKYDEIAHVIWSVLCTELWFKLHDVNASDDDQVVDILSADYSDSSRIWNCSSRYAAEIIAYMRTDHHGLDDDSTNWAFRWHLEPTPQVMAAFRALGWVAIDES